MCKFGNTFSFKKVVWSKKIFINDLTNLYISVIVIYDTRIQKGGIWI